MMLLLDYSIINTFAKYSSYNFAHNNKIEILVRTAPARARVTGRLQDWIFLCSSDVLVFSPIICRKIGGFQLVLGDQAGILGNSITV